MKRAVVDNKPENVQSCSNQEEQIVTNTLIKNDKDDTKKLGPLYHAAHSGDHENLSVLLCLEKSKVAENAKEHCEFLEFCSTVLLNIAAENGHAECVQILIDQGVNVNAAGRTCNCTALHQAAKNGNYECLRRLLDVGADCSIQIYSTSNEIIYPYIPGSTALHLAARYNHIDCVKELIQYGADLNAVDKNGDTSLYVAVESGFIECALAHLSDLSDTDDKRFLSLPSSSSSNTPLHVAIEREMLDIIKKLVHLGSNVNYINKYNKSPLHMACSSKKPQNVELKLEILKLLILEGNYIDMNNALHPNYLQYYDSEIKAFLIAYGANVDFMFENIGASFFEYELKFHIGNPIHLKYIMNCMPRLPFLQSLKVHPIADCLPKHNTVWYSSVLPKNAIFRLVRGQNNMYVEMSLMEYEFDRGHEDLHFLDTVIFHTDSYEEQLHQSPPFEDMCFVDTVFNKPVKKFILLQQPFLDLLYDDSKQKLKEFEQFNFSRHAFRRMPTGLSHEDHLRQLRIHLWYQKMASIPRSLMHHCRYSIRKSMGPSNIKHIPKLPLPEKLQSYLLFECDEVDWDV